MVVIVTRPSHHNSAASHRFVILGSFNRSLQRSEVTLVLSEFLMTLEKDSLLSRSFD